MGERRGGYVGGFLPEGGVFSQCTLLVNGKMREGVPG